MKTNIESIKKSVINPKFVTSINDLHKKFTEYGINAKQWLKKCALMLPDIEKYEVWKHKGFFSIYEYAAKLAGMNKSQVDNALRIMNRIKDKPELIKIAEEKGINAVRPIAVIATQETAKFWAEKADQLTKNELETYVREIRAAQQSAEKPIIQPTVQPFPQSITPPFPQSSLRPFAQSSATLSTPPAKQTKTITMQLNIDIAHKLNKYSNGNFNQFMKNLLNLYEKTLEEELFQEKPQAKEIASHKTPQKIAKFILKRSHGKCEFPNCNKKYQHLHHTERFGSVKRHDPDKIIALCKAHHNLAHKGLISNENFEIKYWKIRKSPDLTDLNRFIDNQVQFYRR